MTELFEKFPSLTRFSHGWTITEKLDGSNGQILVLDRRDPKAGAISGLGMGDDWEPDERALAVVGDYVIFAGSRKRLLTADKQGDHFGFAKFVQERAEEIVAKLGEGRHFGEWVGKGVNKRHYNLDEKRFVLFNAPRWEHADRPDRIDTVPILGSGYIDNPNAAAIGAMAMLKEFGSVYAKGFMNPEGVVMHHGPSNTTFKKTFDYDEAGKWAENQAARERNKA